MVIDRGQLSPASWIFLKFIAATDGEEQLLSAELSSMYNITVMMWAHETIPIIALMQRLWVPDSFRERTHIVIPTD